MSNPPNPTPPAQDGPEFEQWVRRTARRFQEDEEIRPALGAPKQKAMIAYWKAHRPKMYQRIKALGLLEKLAFVLHCLAKEEEDRNLKGGMGWPDSREQAEQGWLLMEPEEDDPLENLPPTERRQAERFLEWEREAEANGTPAEDRWWRQHLEDWGVPWTQTPGPWTELQQALDHGRELVAQSQARRAAKASVEKRLPKNPA